jgi:hypothetical protein
VLAFGFVVLLAFAGREAMRWRKMASIEARRVA